MSTGLSPNPLEFIYTNVLGTATLLNAARHNWKDRHEGKVFYQVSTDEVYGSLGETGHFTEHSPYDPRSPYSASKASSDHMVRAFKHTYGLPVIISNCSNNYGPNQFPEKLIPLCIHNIKNNLPLPVYGKGENVRDWLYVEDNCRAIDLVLYKGKIGEIYNIGGGNEWRNIDLVNLICEILGEVTKKPVDEYKKLITFVKDRPGHDRRYALSSEKIKKDLIWNPKMYLHDSLRKTLKWYLINFIGLKMPF